MISPELEEVPLKDEVSMLGTVVSWVNSMRIGSRTNCWEHTLLCNEPLDLDCSHSGSKDGPLLWFALQPFHNCIRVFCIAGYLINGYQRSSGGRRIGTTCRRNILCIGSRNRGVRRRGRHRDGVRCCWNWRNISQGLNFNGTLPQQNTHLLVPINIFPVAIHPVFICSPNLYFGP